MRIRTLGAVAVLLMTCVPVSVQAHGPWERDRSLIHELREACDWGNRRACVRLGREIEQRREARREWGYVQRPQWSRDPWRNPPGDGWPRGW